MSEADSDLQGARFHAGEDDEYYFEERCYILEYLNDERDPELSITRARVPAGVTTRWHRLRDTTERYLVQSGRGLVGVGDDPVREVGAGDVILIPPMVRQRVENPGPEDLVFLALCTPRFRPENYLDDDAAADREGDDGRG